MKPEKIFDALRGWKLKAVCAAILALLLKLAGQIHPDFRQFLILILFIAFTGILFMSFYVEFFQ